MKENNAVKNQTITKMAEKAWESLTLSDNFIFCKLMMNTELCKKILSEILGREVYKVEYPEYEKSIQARYDAKSVRLDVYLKGDDGTVYNIELQNIRRDSIPKRGRYYQDLIDLDLLEKGAYYKELNRSIVIFICTFDLYEFGYYKYTFTNKCNEVPGLEYGDDTMKIIVNTSGIKGKVSDELKDFLKAVNGQFSNSEFSDKIKEEVERIKRSSEIRREFMALYLHDEDIRRDSLERGIEQGETKKLIKLICKKIQKGKFLEEISDDLEEEQENIRPIYEIAKQCAPEYDCDKIYEQLTNR